MITTSQMYWITRLDGIVTLLAVLASFLCVAGAVIFVCGRNECSAVKQWSWDTDEIIAARRKFGHKLYKASLMIQNCVHYKPFSRQRLLSSTSNGKP